MEQYLEISSQANKSSPVNEFSNTRKTNLAESHILKPDSLQGDFPKSIESTIFTPMPQLQS
jgi:hypothetical protein